MRKSLIILIILFIVTTINVNAQNQPNCTCCNESYMAFDFWVGDWNVFNNSDKQVGTNKVLKLQDGCVIQENWVASNGSNTGTSYNFFNKSDSTWNQVWISNGGNILKLKGGLDGNGVMILKSDIVRGTKGNYYNRISWTKNEDGSVTQKWDILNERSEPIAKAFEGIYKRKK